MNRIIVLLLYLITFSLLLFGQEIDRSNQQSLINSIKQRITSRSDSKVIKCGTPIIATAQRQLTTFPEVLSKAANILWYPRSAKQKSRLSPSGKFRIHYDTTGSSNPALIND